VRPELAALALVAACTAVDVPVAAYVAPTGQYLEAESAERSGGFTVGTHLDASGGAYLASPVDANSDDAPGPARARYVFEIARAADYVVWGRIHSPDAISNRFWFQVDDGPWHKWRISVGDIWYWDALHEDAQYGNELRFTLTEGMHALTFADCMPSVWLDRIYVTADGYEPPGNATPCNPPHSIEVGGACLPSCGSQGGNDCGATMCSGRMTFRAYDCDVCCVR